MLPDPPEYFVQLSTLFMYASSCAFGRTTMSSVDASCQALGAHDGADTALVTRDGAPGTPLKGEQIGEELKALFRA